MKSIAFLTSTCLVILMAYPSCAFTLQSPISTTGRHHHATTTQKKQHGSSLIQLSALPPPLTGHELSDLHNLLSTSHFLSDASSAVAESSSEGGLWESYLNIFKRSLEFVHSTIDQPLKNVGWDQTWGVSIFLFTVSVRSLLLPLSIQQTKSSEYIKCLKPYQDEIKKKFKGNQDMINRATAKLFEDANANPLAGCAVTLLQLPILLGLYRGITLLAKDGQLAQPFLWIPSLEGPVSPPEFRDIDWLLNGWVDGVPSLGWETTLSYLIMPVLLVIGQSITMNVLSPPPDENASREEREQLESTQRVLKFLPLLIGVFSLQVPAGLTIYWFTTNLFTLSQSLAIRAYYKANPPKIELPDYWDNIDDVENMSAEDKRKAAAAGMAVGPKWEDVLDEAKYHYLVERTPLREGSDAWKRAQEANIAIPEEMMQWVGDELNADSTGAPSVNVTGSEDLKTVKA